MRARDGLLTLLLVVGLMPQCCISDPQTIFTDAFDDGSPLSASFVDATGNPGTTNCEVVAGHGINGSSALHSDHSSSDGFTAEASVQFLTNLDQCNNPRQAFAVGGYWNFANGSGDAFSCMEIRNSQVGSQTIVAVQRQGNDLVAVTSDGDEVYRVKNAVDPGVFHKYEFRGQVNTADDAGTAQADGSIEMRRDNIVFQDGADVATFDPNAPPDPCPSARAGIAWLTVGFAAGDNGSWDKVMFGPMGDLDCVYIKESAAYCNDIPPGTGAGSLTCPPAGPAGSSFDGSPQGARAVQPGGTAWPLDPGTLEPIVAGCAIPYGVWRTVPGSGNRRYERFERGCCAEAVAEQRLAFLIDHEVASGFEVTQRNGRLRCWEDEHGLQFAARLPYVEATYRLLASADAGTLRICFGAGTAIDRRTVVNEHGIEETRITRFDFHEFSALFRTLSCFARDTRVRRLSAGAARG